MSCDQVNNRCHVTRWTIDVMWPDESLHSYINIQWQSVWLYEPVYSLRYVPTIPMCVISLWMNDRRFILKFRNIQQSKMCIIRGALLSIYKHTGGCWGSFLLPAPAPSPPGDARSTERRSSRGEELQLRRYESGSRSHTTFHSLLEERERERCPWCWNESAARGLVRYYGYRCP